MIQLSDTEKYKTYFYWPLENLIDHIEAGQKNFLIVHLPFVKLKYETVYSDYVLHQPEFPGFLNSFLETSEILGCEMANDHDAVFPYLRELVDCHHSAREVKVPLFSSLNSFVRESRDRHIAAEKNLRKIIQFTEGIKTANTFSQAGSMTEALQELADTLSMIVHLKFGILYQRSVEMENTVSRCLKSVLPAPANIS